VGVACARVHTHAGGEAERCEAKAAAVSQVTFPSHLGITETRLHRYKTPLEAEYILSGRLAAYATCVASWRCLHPTPSLSLHTCTYTPEEETSKEPRFS